MTPAYKSSMTASAAFNVANNVQITGNYAYITSGQNATYGGAIDVFDITNKASPVKIYTYQQGTPTDVFGASYIINNVLYVADYGVAANTNTYLRTFTTLTKYSPPVSAENLTNISLQVSGAGSSATGTYTLQGSDDSSSHPTNFSDIPNTSGVISGVGTYLVPKTDCCYQWLRVSYTGIGGFTAVLKATEL